MKPGRVFQFLVMIQIKSTTTQQKMGSWIVMLFSRLGVFVSTSRGQLFNLILRFSLHEVTSLAHPFFNEVLPMLTTSAHVPLFVKSQIVNSLLFCFCIQSEIWLLFVSVIPYSCGENIWKLFLPSFTTQSKPQQWSSRDLKDVVFSAVLILCFMKYDWISRGVYQLRTVETCCRTNVYTVYTPQKINKTVDEQ